MTTVEQSLEAKATPRRRWRRRIAVVAVAVLVVVIPVVLRYRGPIWSYLTHWKGAPDQSWPITEFDDVDQRIVHLAVVGDVGDSGSRLTRTASAVAEWELTDRYDVLLLLGDNVYPSGDPAKLPDTVFGPFAATLDGGAELLAILGNHDVKGGQGDEQMSALGMEGRWWQRRYGDVLLVGLDSNTADDPAQLAWFEQVMSTTDATWRIVALHHPPYSAGYQGSSTDVRRIFQPLFERFGVQLVLSGHDHDYQRSEVIGGVTYVVTGAASGTRRTGTDSFTAVSFSWHHFVDLNVFPDRIVVRAVNQDLDVADEFTIPRGSPDG